jgi:hypothetical protein
MNTYRKNLTLYYCTPGLVPTREILVAIRLPQYGHGTSGRTKLSCEPACEDEEAAMALSADAADPLPYGLPRVPWDWDPLVRLSVEIGPRCERNDCTAVRNCVSVLINAREPVSGTVPN